MSLNSSPKTGSDLLFARAKSKIREKYVRPPKKDVRPPRRLLTNPFFMNTLYLAKALFPYPGYSDGCSRSSTVLEGDRLLPRPRRPHLPPLGGEPRPPDPPPRRLAQGPRHGLQGRDRLVARRQAPRARSRETGAPRPRPRAGARRRHDLRHPRPDLLRLVPSLVRSGRVHGAHGRRRPRLARHQQRPPALRPERGPPRGRRPALRQRDGRRRPQLSPRVRPRPPHPRSPEELRAPQGLHVRRRDRDRAQARPRAGRAAHARGARRRLGPAGRGLARRRLPGPLRRRRSASTTRSARPAAPRRSRRTTSRARKGRCRSSRAASPTACAAPSASRPRPGPRPSPSARSRPRASTRPPGPSPASTWSIHRTGRAREDHRPVRPGPRGRSRLPPGLPRAGRRLPVPVRLRGGQPRTRCA